MRWKEIVRAFRDALRSSKDLPEPDLTVCPECGGPADNGFSREFPPLPYVCSKCTEGK